MLCPLCNRCVKLKLSWIAIVMKKRRMVMLNFLFTVLAMTGWGLVMEESDSFLIYFDFNAGVMPEISFRSLLLLSTLEHLWCLLKTGSNPREWQMFRFCTCHVQESDKPENVWFFFIAMNLSSNIFTTFNPIIRKKLSQDKIVRSKKGWNP